MRAAGLAFAVAGSLLTLTAAVGLIRLPDPVTRLHAVTKASSLGTVLMMTGVVVALPFVDVAVKAALVVIFQVITAPVAAHVIGRAAYRTGLLTDLRIDEVAEAGDEPGA